MFVKNAEKIFAKEDLFSCCDPNLKDFLCDKGIIYISKKTDENDENLCWLFLINNRLSECLLEWTKIPKNYG